MGDIANWVAALAAIAALALSVSVSRRQSKSEATSYLSLALTVTRSGAGQVVAETSLENRSPQPKEVETVFLLVGPYGEDPTDTMNSILESDAVTTVQDMTQFGAASIALASSRHVGDRLFLRLTYYTVENSEVGDERLTFDALLDTAHLVSGESYSVRLFLYGPRRLHRVVHRILVVD